LISQIFVEEFTLQFLNLYGCEFIIRLSLFTEWMGICNFSWLLYGIVSRVICYVISIGTYVLPTLIPAAYIIVIVTMCILFYLEGLMIAVVGTQYWDLTVFKEVYQRAYEVHRLRNQPENEKRFVIGRQFFMVLTNFLLAKNFTFANWKTPELTQLCSSLE
jgi:hypothetical protein